MSEELPPDVRATLVRLFEEAAEDARTRDEESVRTRLETVEAVTDDDVPPGSGKERLRHGCAQVRKTVENEPLVAAEYLQAMRRLVDEDADGPGVDVDSRDGDDGGEERDEGESGLDGGTPDEDEEEDADEDAAPDGGTDADSS
ncbi:hypothetical protein [Halopelagius longus]|uniref:DUF8101 domain-containing protein n=1 Tax=Halopelagius longus TaxID=1236180 RepID=A0A1H0Z9U4_9EURY|nr:hypothetical protein [Halopelagius longus]RDI72900.1 hypothetical protein DWB78_14865 [Halopelagius longus]SDQ24183.1 hypothetical protein SAMN05216278_1099 [Halopelagius longus]